MPTAHPETIELLRHDSDAREEVLRALIRERLGENPPPRMDDHIVATYFFAFRTQTLDQAVAEISYHATSGIKHPPKGSLLEACSASQAGVDPFDAARKIGLLHVAFPLKMMLQPDGHLTSCDILHTVAGAVIFDFYENMDARLVRLTIPDRVLAHLPRPGLRPARRPEARRLRRRPARLRHDPQADGRHHGRRRRPARGRGRRAARS